MAPFDPDPQINRLSKLRAASIVKITESAKAAAAGPGLTVAINWNRTREARIATTKTSIIDQRPTNSTR